MFGNDRELKEKTRLLNKAFFHWAKIIIALDPAIRKLQIDDYKDYIARYENDHGDFSMMRTEPKEAVKDLYIIYKNVLEIVEEKIKSETYEGENYIWGSILGVKSEIINDPNSLFNKRLKQIKEDFPEILCDEEDDDDNEFKDWLYSRDKKSSKTNKEEVQKQPNSWDSFYTEFDGKFDEEQSLGIELFDSEEVREKLEKLGYKINTSNFLDCTKVGEYFPTISDESEESVIIVFHKLPLDFDFDEGNDLVKQWFGFYKKYIKSLDPYFMEDESTEVKEDESTEVKSSEKLQYLKNFTKNWFESESKEWLNFLVEKTKERTYGHFESKPEEFWWDPKKVEDWEYECAAALTASCIDQYESKGKEFVTEMLRAHFAETNSIGEELSTKIQMILLHSSMIGFENYFLNDCKLGGNESIKLTDEIVLKAFKIDLN